MTAVSDQLQALNQDLKAAGLPEDAPIDIGSKLLSLGWKKEIVPEVPNLDFYKQDQVVSVLGADMSWREGRVREVFREGGKVVRLSADTERGPVTIASRNKIRPA